MKTIETDILVASNGIAVVELQLPPTVSPGKHRAVVMVDEGQPLTASQPMELPVHEFGPWPQTLSLHREDLYDEHGR